MYRTIISFFVFISFLICNSLYAITGTAISNGNWSAGSSWSFGRAPANNDTIVVPFGKTITVTINSPTYTNMLLNVSGVLFFNNGQKLNFNCNSVVIINGTGKLDGGNPGSKIDMCGTTVWRGPGPTTGPLVYGYNPLPINLLNFSANTCEKQVCLNWATLTETNNDFFTVEKTKDDFNYQIVSTLKGAGNSTSIKNYTLTDTRPYEGVSYYRLKQTDFNGAFAYYSLREIDRNASLDFELNLYPNPGNRGTINLAVRSEMGKEVLVVVYDITGRETYSKVLITERNGENVFALDPSGKLEKGIYFVTGTSDKRVDSKKLIIN